jgi:hypothetical protein
LELERFFGELLVRLSHFSQREFRFSIKPILVAELGSGAFFPFFALGFERTGVAVASVIAIGLAPTFVGFISWII